MIPISEIQWGPIDASEPEELFSKKYIITEEFTGLYNRDVCIIAGEKGSGKTAFAKSYIERHSAEFEHIINLNFDQIEYSAIVKSIYQVGDIFKAEPFLFVTNYIQYFIIMKAAEQYFAHNHNSSFSAVRCRNFLKRIGRQEGGLTGTILYLVGSTWQLISDLTSPAHRDRLRSARYEIMPSNLTPEVIEKARNYPLFEPEFVNFQKDFAICLLETNSKILVIMDGLDKLDTASTEIKRGLETIFNGLAQAIYQMSISELFHDKFVVKSLFPYDRFLQLSQRDLDKISHKSMKIIWTYSSIKKFLAQRLSLHKSIGVNWSFEQMWAEVMPDYVYNSVHNINEKTYDYICRHTLYRPRQIQSILLRLARRYPNQIIQENMLSGIVRDVSKEATENFIKEFQIDHPNLGLFLTSLRGEKNIMSFYDLKEILKNRLKRYGVKIDPEQKCDALYELGLFGVIRNDELHGEYFPERKANMNKYHVDFFYKNPTYRISSALADSDEIAIHPMFFDYCQLKSDKERIVG